MVNAQVSFPNLDSLDLDGIPADKIWCCSLEFQNLSSLKIKRCGNLKYLLTYHMATHLVHLRELQIHGCNTLEEIVLKDDSGEDKTIDVIFGKLEGLELHHLPNLKRFMVGIKSLQFLSLRRIAISTCNKLEALVSGDITQDEKESGGTVRAVEESHYHSLFSGKVRFFITLFFLIVPYRPSFK